MKLSVEMYNNNIYNNSHNIIEKRNLGISTKTTK